MTKFDINDAMCDVHSSMCDVHSSKRLLDFFESNYSSIVLAS